MGSMPREQVARAVVAAGVGYQACPRGGDRETLDVLDSSAEIGMDGRRITSVKSGIGHACDFSFAREAEATRV